MNLGLLTVDSSSIKVPIGLLDARGGTPISIHPIPLAIGSSGAIVTVTEPRFISV